jgi:hypothetical protein
MKTKRIELMRRYKTLAAEYDRRGDVVLRAQAANDWRDLATAAEAAKAPRYLAWRGRYSR